ncbi:MAG: hypothetical protein AB200_00390 [Parcubacteria bacterium C7867-005]|nr:MAG: hypothetical protein AB200_00390 [Parcubacteria bacterium C7867-005]
MTVIGAAAVLVAGAGGGRRARAVDADADDVRAAMDHGVHTGPRVGGREERDGRRSEGAADHVDPPNEWSVLVVASQGDSLSLDLNKLTLAYIQNKVNSLYKKIRTDGNRCG